MELSPTQLSLWSTACTAIGWLTNHWLRVGLDRRTRLRNFRNRVSCITAEIEVETDKDLRTAHRRSTPIVRNESASIEEDVRWWRRDRFKHLVVKYCGATERDAENEAVKLVSQRLFARTQTDEFPVASSQELRDSMIVDLRHLSTLAR